MLSAFLECLAALPPINTLVMAPGTVTGLLLPTGGARPQVVTIRNSRDSICARLIEALPASTRRMGLTPSADILVARRVSIPHVHTDTGVQPHAIVMFLGDRYHM